MPLHELSLTEMREGLRSKRFSSVELTKRCLERASELKELNCFIDLSEELALKEAELADKLLASGESRALLGIPVAIKDMICTRGTRTTCASKILENYISPYEATVVKNLRKHGAVVFGKTNMDEFAMGGSNENSAYGPVRNPWDKNRVAGGSSGGSAAAVSAKIVPTALGTDTGGSVRQPASFCGLVGVKPTYGRVSRYGVVAFASSLDQVGTFARTVKDSALVTECICDHDPLDSTSVERDGLDLFGACNRSVKGARIGVPKEYFIPGLNDEVKAALDVALKVLEQNGFQVVEVSLPHTQYAVPVYYVIAPAEASSNLARFDGVRYGIRSKEIGGLADLYSKTRAQNFGKEVQRRIMIGTYVLSSGYYDAYYLRAQKVRTLIAQDFKRAFESCDLIVSPTAPTTPFLIGAKSNDPLAMYLGDIFTIPVNLAGLPGLSLPCGFNSAGLPIGMQLIAKPWEEELMYSVAAAYEGATEWHKRSPTI